MEKDRRIVLSDITGFRVNTDIESYKTIYDYELETRIRCDSRIMGSGMKTLNFNAADYNQFINNDDYYGYSFIDEIDEEGEVIKKAGIETYSINLENVMAVGYTDRYGWDISPCRKSRKDYAYEVHKRELAFRKKKKEYYQILFENRNY